VSVPPPPAPLAGLGAGGQAARARSVAQGTGRQRPACGPLLAQRLCPRNPRRTRPRDDPGWARQAGVSLLSSRGHSTHRSDQLRRGMHGHVLLWRGAWAPVAVACLVCNQWGSDHYLAWLLEHLWTVCKCFGFSSITVECEPLHFVPKRVGPCLNFTAG
jgi:hypothetical protein